MTVKQPLGVHVFMHHHGRREKDGPKMFVILSEVNVNGLCHAWL